MEKINLLHYKGPWWIPVLILIAIALTIALGLFVPPASADVLVYGSQLNYSEVILPNNSYVHQGENISQGNYYDLRGVYGFSGELAHWNDDYFVGMGQPDQVIDLTNPQSTCIDPITFPVGRYWQWDGQTCSAATDTLCTNGFGNDNAYVFAVVPQPITLQSKTVVLTSNITISQNGSQVQIPVTFTEVQTYYGTPVPTTTPASEGTIAIPTTIIPQDIGAQPQGGDVQDQNGVPIIGGVPGAVPVTPKSPVPIEVPVIAIGIISLIMVRKE